MKVGDLRIGNWYNSVKWNIPVRCELPDLYNLSALADGADDDPPIDEMFEPIPLTEEWLLKFGFELKDDVNRGFTIQINYQYMENYLYANAKYYTTALYDGKEHKEFFVNPVEYVHQLQNLYFALIGEELTIK